MNDLAPDFGWIALAVENGVVPPKPSFVTQAVLLTIIRDSEQRFHLSSRLALNLPADLVEGLPGSRGRRATDPQKEQTDAKKK